MTAFWPPKLTFELEVRNATSPMIMPEITPPATPASSPALIGILEPSVSAGMLQMRTLVLAFTAIAHCAMFGNGVGIGGAGGAGTWHTSGTPMHMPPAMVVAGNIGARVYAELRSAVGLKVFAPRAFGVRLA